MRDRLVTGQAQDRQDVARLLGVHRHTVGRWRARDAAGGLDAWLATYVPTGTPVSLARCSTVKSFCLRSPGP